ncbi:MAG: ABC transporter permease [Vicinamibacteria bacterium]|nr:ABC transporter permease [Vicinamibacteria bacterium]
MFDRLLSDAVAAVRSMRRMPFIVGGAVATVALAVGLNVAVFGLIHRALLAAPAHVVDPANVVTLGFGAPGEADPRATMSSTSYVAFRAIRESVTAIKSAAAFQRSAATILIDGDQRNANAMLVSGEYFALLGARALLGRALGPGDDDAGAPAPAVVLTHAFWRTSLREDRGVIGRRMKIAGIEYTVAGVMPRGFSGHATTKVDVFVPFAAAMRNSPGWDREAFRNIASVLVRLAAGQTEAAVAAQAGSVLERVVVTKPLSGSEVGETEKRVALWLSALAVLVLIIGLANSAILLTVRAVRGRHEQAIRTALGASPSQLRLQVLVEAILLASAATAASLMIAAWFDDALRVVLFPNLRAEGGRVFVTFGAATFAGLAAAAVAFAAGLLQIPSSTQPAHLRAGTPGTGPRRRNMAPLLIIQTTLAVVLLAGAGLFGASLHRLRAQDFGMDLTHVVVVDFEQTSAELSGQDAFFMGALARVAGLAGIESATLIDSLPFAGHNVPPISVPGRSEPPSVGGQLPFLTAATPEFLKILGIEVVEGRGFTAADDRAAPVVLVNRTMAGAVWPGESAIGKCFRVGFDPDFNPETFDPSSGPPMPSDKVACREVVGVFRDVRQRSVLPDGGEDRLMQYLVPFSQVPKPAFVQDPTNIRGLLLKVRANNGSAPGDIRRAIVALRGDLPYLRVRPYLELLDRQMRPWTMGTRLLGLFSAIALFVSAIGMFAAFAHAIAERRREMAIRLAIGALPSSVRSLVLREALSIAAGGVVAGLLLSILAGRGIASLLFATTPADPLVLGLASGAMLLVAAVATFLPAREAARADPSVLLRSE